MPVLIGVHMWHTVPVNEWFSWLSDTVTFCLKIIDFWDVARCSLVNSYQHFVGTCPSIFRVEEYFSILMMEASDSIKSLVTIRLHGITTQNMVVFIVNAVKISNLTTFCFLSLVSKYFLGRKIHLQPVTLIQRYVILYTAYLNRQTSKHIL